MKTLLTSIFTLVVSLVLINNQEGITLNATFDGHFDGLYSFSPIVEEDEFAEQIVFTEVSEKLLEQYNLKSSNLIGKDFAITYTEDVEYEDDEELIVYTLVSLKLIE